MIQVCELFCELFFYGNIEFQNYKIYAVLISHRAI